MSEQATNPQRVEIEIRKPSTLQLFIYDRMPNVPEWIEIELAPGDHPFWTMPAHHYFESTEGEFGFPGELQTIARRFDAGEISQEEAERALNDVLIGWSRATHREETNLA
jgi:hypothetical protein